MEDRERADGVPRGLYRRLEESGRLHVLDGLETACPHTLAAILRESGVSPSIVLHDRFAPTLVRDALKGWPSKERITRWSTGAEDIGLTREFARDGGLSFEESSRGLLSLGLSQAAVRYDDSGNCRIVKRRGDSSRDDVAVALSLAAGEALRRLRRPPPPKLWSVPV